VQRHENGHHLLRGCAIVGWSSILLYDALNALKLNGDLKWRRRRNHAAIKCIVRDVLLNLIFLRNAAAQQVIGARMRDEACLVAVVDAHKRPMVCRRVVDDESQVEKTRWPMCHNQDLIELVIVVVHDTLFAINEQVAALDKVAEERKHLLHLSDAGRAHGHHGGGCRCRCRRRRLIRAHVLDSLSISCICALVYPVDVILYVCLSVSDCTHTHTDTPYQTHACASTIRGKYNLIIFITIYMIAFNLDCNFANSSFLLLMQPSCAQSSSSLSSFSSRCCFFFFFRDDDAQKSRP
jgi:hypothetical protein